MHKPGDHYVLSPIPRGGNREQLETPAPSRHQARKRGVQDTPSAAAAEPGNPITAAGNPTAAGSDGQAGDDPPGAPGDAVGDARGGQGREEEDMEDAGRSAANGGGGAADGQQVNARREAWAQVRGDLGGPLCLCPSESL